MLRQLLSEDIEGVLQLRLWFDRCVLFEQFFFIILILTWSWAPSVLSRTWAALLV